jgi:hypothetical protein
MTELDPKGLEAAKERIRLKLRELIRDQSEGEWGEDMIRRDADIFTEELWGLLYPSSGRAILYFANTAIEGVAL